MAAVAWQPDPSGLRTVVGILHESTQGTTARHDVLYKQLEAYAMHADFNNYLAYILAHGMGSQDIASANAGTGGSVDSLNITGAGFSNGPRSTHSTASGVTGADTSAVVNGASGRVNVSGTGDGTGLEGQMGAASVEKATEGVRQAAGLLLKNNLVVLYKNLTSEMRSYINIELLTALNDSSKYVRSAVAVCITAIVSTGGLQVWPDLIPTLIGCLDSNQASSLDGALTVLCRICEDVPDLLDSDPSQPLDLLIPKLASFVQHPSDAVRTKVLHILNQIVLIMPVALLNHMDTYLSALFRVADDASADVRKRVCTAICLLLESRPEALAPHIRDVIQYMLKASTDPSTEVALEACEFWAIYVEVSDASSTLREFLPRLIPMLLDNMVYSEDDRALFETELEDDTMVPDRPEDTKPRFHQARIVDSKERLGSAHMATASGATLRAGAAIDSTLSSTQAVANGGGREAHSGLGANGAQASNEYPNANGAVFATGGDGLRLHGPLAQRPAANLEASGVPLDSAPRQGVAFAANGTRHNGPEAAGGKHGTEDDIEDNDSDTEDVDGEWNIRKCSASALDTLSAAYPDEVLYMLLPRLQERMANERAWEQREVGVLALGAISDGCLSGIAPHLPKLFPYLMASINDSSRHVRLISCWTLSRYSRWLLDSNDEANVQGMLKALLDRMMDKNKAVQRSACSALAVVEEQAGPAIAKYLAPILHAVSLAFDTYQKNNLTALYDCVCTLADAAGGDFARPEHVNVLMPRLITRWNACQDDDEGLIPLLECLSFVFRALGTASQSFVLPVLTRCASILNRIHTEEASGKTEAVNGEFITCVLDVVCSLTEALSGGIDPLIVSRAGNGKPLLELVYLAMRDHRQEVRQSALAAAGEFARAGLPCLVPVLKDYIVATANALSPDYMSVANNATWALGEMVIMAGFLPPGIPIDRDAIKEPLIADALPRLVRIVNVPALNRSLLENTAIALGRMALVMADAMAPQLESFAEAMLSVLRNIPDHLDKEQAFFGMNAMVKLNPGAILKCFVYYADAVGSWLHVNPKLEAEFATILTGYKTSLGSSWEPLYESFPSSLKLVLHGRFSI